MTTPTELEAFEAWYPANAVIGPGIGVKELMLCAWQAARASQVAAPPALPASHPKNCPICATGKLHEIVSSRCQSCGSEVADGEQSKRNKASVLAARAALPASQESDDLDALTAAYFSGFHNGRRHAKSAAIPLLDATPQPAEQTPVITFDANDIEFHASRIRRLAAATGTEKCLPNNNRTLVACVGSIIGAMLTVIEKQPAGKAELSDERIDKLSLAAFGDFPARVTLHSLRKYARALLTMKGKQS